MHISHQTIKETAQGMFARRMCGSIMETITPTRNLDINFDFIGLISRCDLPKTGELAEHKKSWAEFHREFEIDFRDYVNNRKDSK